MPTPNNNFRVDFGRDVEVSGACTTLEAICISCEFALQDDRARNNSYGMNRSE